MNAPGRKPTTRARRFTVLGMMVVVALLGCSLGLWRYLDRCEDRQTIAWKGWIVDLSSKAEAAREHAGRSRLAGKDSEEAAWQARAEWYEGRLQRAMKSLADAEEECRISNR